MTKKITHAEMLEFFEEFGTPKEHGAVARFTEKVEGAEYETVRRWFAGKQLPDGLFRYAMSALLAGLEPWHSKNLTKEK